LPIFLGKAFDLDFLQKYVDGVFELTLPRNAQKRTKKKSKKQKSDGGWVGLGFSKIGFSDCDRDSGTKKRQKTRLKRTEERNDFGYFFQKSPLPLS
jgi:hypothetical protein